MGSKEELLLDIIKNDRFEVVDKIHTNLIDLGLKFKGPSNSKTLFYFFRKDNKEIGVAAIRRGIFSFPSKFWSLRNDKLSEIMSDFKSFQKIRTEPSISSSQFSAGQISINSDTANSIIETIKGPLLKEITKAGFKIK